MNKRIQNYRPTYALERIDYQRIIALNHEIEAIVSYVADEHILTYPPDQTQMYQEIITLLRGTGISKLTITFLDRNLQKGEDKNGKK